MARVPWGKAAAFMPATTAGVTQRKSAWLLTRTLGVRLPSPAFAFALRVRLSHMRSGLQGHFVVCHRQDGPDPGEHVAEPKDA